MNGQTEAFPQTPEEIRIARLSKVQVKLTEDVNKADKSIEGAVEKHRLALLLLEDCEAVIRDLRDIMTSGANPSSGEVLDG